MPKGWRSSLLRKVDSFSAVEAEPGLSLHERTKVGAAPRQSVREEWDSAFKLRSEERRVGKGVDLGGRRSIKKKKKKNKNGKEIRNTPLTNTKRLTINVSS